MKLLYLGLNPIQNPKPYRLLNGVPDLQYLVAYLKKPGDHFGGKENLNKLAFTHDITAGYEHRYLKNRSIFKRGNFLSNFHPEVFGLIRQFDVAVVYGHHTLTFLCAIFFARLVGTKIVLTTDATYIEGNDESAGLKLKLKPILLRFLYNVLANGVFVPSTASRMFLESIGIKSDRIVVTPYVVDEDLIEKVSEETDSEQLRKDLGFTLDDFIWVFCAKLISRKRPVDAVKGLAGISDTSVKLLMIGTGPEEAAVQAEIVKQNLQDRVKLVGLVKYTELATYYTSSNALLFCSDHEPYGLPVNEAMLCGIPVLISDRIGSGIDLLVQGETGYSYRCGDIEDLCKKMALMCGDAHTTKLMGEKAKVKMQKWSSQTNVDRQFQFFKIKGWWK